MLDRLDARPNRPNVVPTASAALAALQRGFKEGGRYHGPTDAAKEVEAAQLTLRASSLFTQGALPAEFDRELLAAAEAMADGASWMPAIAERWGLARALDVKLRSFELGPTSVAIGGQSRYVIGQRSGGWLADPGSSRLPQLRALLCRTDDASYAEARDFAQRARESAHPVLRAALSFVFPEEPAWAIDDLRSVLATPPQRTNFHTFAVLFGSVDDPKLLLEWIAKVTVWAGWYASAYVCDAVLRLSPEDATDVVGALFRRSIENRRMAVPESEALGVALLALRTLGIGRALAPQLLHPAYGRWARDWFRAHPMLADEALAAQCEQKSVIGDVSRRVRSSLAPRSPAPDLPDLPAWLLPRARTLPITPDLGLPHPPREAQFPWAEGERERCLVTPDTSTGRIMTEEVLARWRALAVNVRYVDVWAQWENGKWVHWGVPNDEGLALWNAEPTAPHRHPTTHMLALHGDAAFPGLLARDAFDDLVRCRSPAVAIVCARALRSIARRRRAREWLVENAEIAGRGLIPFAFGPPGRKKHDAETALRWIARADRSAVVRAAESLGARSETEEWLDRDLLDLAPPERAPRQLVPLPPLRLLDGRTLPDAAVRRVVDALRAAAPHSPDRRLSELRDALDPGSRDEFAFAIFQDWAIAGATSSSAWLTYAVPWLGTTTTLRRVWPFLHYWAIRSGKRAALVLDAIEAAGTEEALALVARVAEGKAVEPVRIVARAILDGAAKARSITTPELLDRIAPTFGAEKGSAIVLDLGGRTFRVSLLDDLTPTLIGEDGRRLAQLPRPSARDDAAKAEVAAERWRWIAAEAKIAARTQTRRLERAMVVGQRWKRDAFTDHLLRHPFLSILARRLVWSSGALTFRIADDGAITSLDDRTIELPADESIHLPHPLSLDPELIGAWSTVFADYAIVQPFEQLGRAIFVMSESVRAGTKIDSATGRIVPARRVVSIFDAMGWAHGRFSLRKSDGGTAYAYLSATPGHGLRALSAEKMQTLGVVTLYGAKSFAEIVDVDLSELLRAIDALR